MTIRVSGICKRFGSFVALDRVDLEIRTGELLALLGPSGSGKTTLLRILGGLERPDQGSLTFFGEAALGLTPRDRQVGFVFQHYSLFRHMTVFNNVAFGLDVLARKDRPSRAAITEKVTELLRMVQLEPLADRYPSQLSGGQRQGWRWRGLWLSNRACCCWMNPLEPWMPRFAKSCVVGCVVCMMRCTLPASS